MGTLVEVSNDEKGIIWPEQVTPYQVHLLVISDKSQVISQAQEIYQKLQKAGIEVLFDDRKDVSAGEKFADCDLIGIPVRLVVSDKTGKGKVEWKERDKGKVEILTIDEVIKRV
ncbi:MAG: Proline-tRNA ligase [Candidatus Curtissbacteria bacterium GW2011_GWB1_40_28]|nr:MAG: Proline-tRNA ligase [Candidatus Curtissbacteria bacterium GW2011_GWB1_40_28]